MAMSRSASTLIAAQLCAQTVSGYIGCSPDPTLKSKNLPKSHGAPGGEGQPSRASFGTSDS